MCIPRGPLTNIVTEYSLFYRALLQKRSTISSILLYSWEDLLAFLPCTFRYAFQIYIGWQTPIGCLIFICHFLQKSPIISGSFAKNDLQLKASNGSSPPCTHLRYAFQTYSSHVAYVNESCHMWMSHVPYEWVMAHTHLRYAFQTYSSHVAYVNESCHIW